MPPRPNRLLINCYRDESAIAEEFDMPGKDLPDSQNENTDGKTDKMVRLARIATLVFAILGLVLFEMTLIKFIKRLKVNISYTK